MKTLFLRVLEADVDDKAAALRAAIHAPEAAAGRTRFEVDPAGFSVVPTSPFAYWVSERLRGVFRDYPVFESGGRIARQGLATADDFRFVRLSTEVAPASVGQRWFPFAKGGKYSPYYADVYLVVDWGENGHLAKAWAGSLYGGSHWSRILKNTEHYFRPGLTWPRRTQSGLSLRVMPAGCIFGDKGPGIFVEDDDPTALLALLAVTNTRAFGGLVDLQMAFGSYEVGVIQRTPVPDLSPADRSALAALARRAWSLKRGLDTITETSHAFELPALLAAGSRRQAAGGSLEERAAAWNAHVADTLAELDRIQAGIDERCFALYGISGEDRRSIERGFGAETEATDEPEEPGDVPPTDPKPLVAQLLSWSLGVAFGRFDLRLATGERPEPPEPEPFDPLPTCSPGMLTGDDGLPLPSFSLLPDTYPLQPAARGLPPDDGILVDDPGHPRDLTAAVRAVFDIVFDDGNARWHEAADLVGARGGDLRAWFARDFFPAHIKACSMSRRKAPIYWQLATPSASYSAWLYVHRFTRDTLYRLLNDFVGPKLSHEESKLAQLVKDAGPEPSRGQRAEIDAQESFVEELRAFKAEVARVAPLWNPDLDDGVIINFAPLWRLVPQHKGWQKEVKKVWDKLVAGDYDWAHLAMHLWPERVVPKCREDRSLAIAHGLEDAFWVQEADGRQQVSGSASPPPDARRLPPGGKWHPREVDDATVAALVAERSSSAVKAALDDLLSAPAPAAGRKPARRGGGRRSAASRRSAPRRGRAAASVDEALVAEVRRAIAQVAGGASKNDVLDAVGITAAEWNRAIKVLLERGQVERTGKARGTRYHPKGQNNA